jgi:Zn-dependent protease
MECFLLVTVLWVFSVCLHEFGHAAAAYCGGDYTVKDKGYLTLNPFRYAHPVYSLLMPVVFVLMGGIGLPGGAVYIDHSLLRSRAWETWVSLAGIAMNLVMVVLIGSLFKFGILPDDPQSLISVSLALLLQLEIGSILLCLIPVPPLDGFQAIAPWLPAEIRQQLFSVSNMSMWVLVLALWYVQPLGHAFWSAVGFFTDLFGMDPYLSYVGWHAFRFWEH